MRNYIEPQRVAVIICDIHSQLNRLHFQTCLPLPDVQVAVTLKKERANCTIYILWLVLILIHKIVERINLSTIFKETACGLFIPPRMNLLLLGLDESEIV